MNALAKPAPITVGDWKVGMGYRRDGWTLTHTVHGLVATYWPSYSAEGTPGWCWCISTPDGAWLAGAWDMGSALAMKVEIARAIVRFRDRGAA